LGGEGKGIRPEKEGSEDFTAAKRRRKEKEKKSPGSLCLTSPGWKGKKGTGEKKRKKIKYARCLLCAQQGRRGKKGLSLVANKKERGGTRNKREKPPACRVVGKKKGRKENVRFSSALKKKEEKMEAVSGKRGKKENLLRHVEKKRN